MGILRIISGKWRSRKIKLPNFTIPGIRPTPNMVRETLFNWLGDQIIGANCLDLFAGSGALSFEALSRGAKTVVAIDCNKKIIENLKKTALTLKADNLIVISANIPKQFSLIPDNYMFDIVFLDPPFNKDLLKPTIEKLEQSNILATSALIYIETEKNLDIIPFLPKKWKILRNKTSGQVKYYLIHRTAIPALRAMNCRD